MKRLSVAMIGVAVFVGAAAWSRTSYRAFPNNAAVVQKKTNEFKIRSEQRNPWNHLKLNNGSSTFRFAIVTDRTGGPRSGVFERAIAQLNFMQPEFIVSVGDLIQGGTTDKKKLDRQWNEFNGFIKNLDMPFFYVAGNHDIGNKVMAKKWSDQFGRSYYHFLYKNVLFLLLNTEDVPGIGEGRFTDKQIAFAKEILAKYTNVRWTMVFLHKPMWRYNQKQIQKSRWPEIEKLLQDRKHSVFAGHYHTYRLDKRNGMKYFTLATTGGGSRLRGPQLNEFDHIMWVTMKNRGPVFANLMLEGIFADDLRAIAIPKTGMKAKIP